MPASGHYPTASTKGYKLPPGLASPRNKPPRRPAGRSSRPDRRTHLPIEQRPHPNPVQTCPTRRRHDCRRKNAAEGGNVTCRARTSRLSSSRIVMREMRPVLEARAGQTGKLPNQTCGSATATGSICGGEGENVTSVGLLAWLFVTAVGLQERKPHHPPQPTLDVFGCHSLVVSLNPLHCPMHRCLGTYRSPLPR